MRLTINFYSVLIFALILFGFFQTGRVYDDHRCIVSQPEYNHMVYIDRCEVVTDTVDEVIVIMYNNKPYVYEPSVLDNL